MQAASECTSISANVTARHPADSCQLSCQTLAVGTLLQSSPSLVLKIEMTVSGLQITLEIQIFRLLSPITRSFSRSYSEAAARSCIASCAIFYTHYLKLQKCLVF